MMNKNNKSNVFITYDTWQRERATATVGVGVAAVERRVKLLAEADGRRVLGHRDPDIRDGAVRRHLQLPRPDLQVPKLP